MLEPIIRGSCSKEWKKVLPTNGTHSLESSRQIPWQRYSALLVAVPFSCNVITRKHQSRIMRERADIVQPRFAHFSDFSRRNYDTDKPVSVAPDHDY